MNLKIGLFVAGVLAATSLPQTAQAQDYSLHYVQAGALLDYADAEVRVLYAAVTAREYDPKVTKDTLKELKETLDKAKRHAGRAGTLLPENLMKHEPAVEKLRGEISKAEDQLVKLATDIDEQTKALFADEAEVELGERSEDTGEAEPAKTDWDLLKKGTGWLGVDIAGARRMHKSLARKIKVKGLKFPPKPRGKRPE